MYYVVCQSVIGGYNHVSNEVEVEVVATTAAAYDIKWLGNTSSDVHEMTNWFPISHIEGNNLFVDTPYVHAPVLSSAGNDHIAGFDVQDGASFTLNKPSMADTLFKGSDWYLYGELIVQGGVFRINGRLRLEANTPKVSVTGGKILMTGVNGDFIVGTADGTAGAEYIDISGDGVIDAGYQIWRWATDSLKSVITITDDAKLFVHADFRGVIETRMARRQILTDSDQVLVMVYPYIVSEDTMTMVYAKDTAAFAIAPVGQQIVGLNEQASELSTLNAGDKVGFEWKYTTTSGSGYVSFEPAQKESTCKPAFGAAGTYYVVCEAYSLTDTVLSINEVEIVAVSVTIAPTEMQTIIPAEDGTALTVTESLAADSRAWKYSTTSGSGYVPLTGMPTGISWTPLFTSAGSYYVVCVSNYGTKTITSNEVNIRVVTVTIAPTETQLIAPTNAGTTLTVTESIAADSRAWKYTTTSGSDYVAAPGNPTGTSWAPVFDSEGTYYVVCVSTYGTLEVITDEVEIDVVAGVAVEDLEANDIMLYPNPATDRFYISSAKTGNYTIHLIDMQGRLVMAREFYNVTGPQLITVNQSGIFFVKIVTGDSVRVTKIILE
jgi:plastocyanin